MTKTNPLYAELSRLRAENEMLAWLCLSHGLISRGKFAALLKIDRCDVDDKMEEIARDRLKERKG
jgi:malate synthase